MGPIRLLEEALLAAPRGATARDAMRVSVLAMMPWPVRPVYVTPKSERTDMLCGDPDSWDMLARY
jgi:hypothetical protein